MGFPRDRFLIHETVQKDTAFAGVEQARIAEQLAKLDTNDCDAFLLAAMALFALPGNGHTRLIPNSAVKVFPIRLIWAGGGLWAMDETPRQVADVNDVPVGEIYESFKPFLAGTAGRRRVVGGLPMAWPTALQEAGVPEAQSCRYRFADGTERTFGASSLCPALHHYPHFETGFPDPSLDPFSLEDRSNTLRLAAFTTGDGDDFAARVRSALNKIDALQPGPVVIDLRGNPGGDFLRHLPILKALKPVASRHHIGVLVDRFTFSAAIVFAALCKHHLGASVLGETMGDAARFHAEGGTLDLPDSGAKLRWSDGYHDWETGIPQSSTPQDIAAEMIGCGSLDPALHAVSTPGDLSKGRDPAWKTAIDYLKGEPACAP